MKELPEIDRRKAGIALGISSLLLTIFLAAGINYDEARGTCHTETRTCHGVPMGNSCIGVETSEKNFNSSCSQIDSIEASCQSVREGLCSQGGDWEDAVVEGYSCGFWDKKYDIDVKSCETVNQTEE
jgi:hypothetical protein